MLLFIYLFIYLIIIIFFGGRGGYSVSELRIE